MKIQDFMHFSPLGEGHFEEPEGGAAKKRP